MDNRNQEIVIPHPNEFKTGYRVLFLLLRSKEGGGNRREDNHGIRVISNGVEEFNDQLNRLLAMRTGQERIYSTVDERDMDRAIRIFKQRQLDADYYDRDSRESFYVSIHDRFISSLHSEQAAKTSYFMVDVDEEDDYGAIKGEIAEKGLDILHEYPTKNGHHIILKPFNPNIVSFRDRIQKNASMLLAYNAYRNDQL